MKLSIIVPVYNEEKTVTAILDKVEKVNLPKGVAKELVVVDDGSTDNSKFKIKNAKLQLKNKQSLTTYKDFKLIEHKKNKGKGAAVRTGFKNATGDILLIQDADLEYNPEDFPKLLRPILRGKASVVYGTRLVNYPLRLWGKNKTPMPLHYIGNKLITFVTNLVYGGSITDMETCYKVFTRGALKGIKLKANGFDIEPEITAKILKKGYKIHEVPIKVKPRGYDEGKKISWIDGVIAVWTLLKYKVSD